MIPGISLFNSFFLHLYSFAYALGNLNDAFGYMANALVYFAHPVGKQKKAACSKEIFSCKNAKKT